MSKKKIKPSGLRQGFKKKKKKKGEFSPKGPPPPPPVSGKKNKKLKYSVSLNSARTLKKKLLSAIF